MKRTKVDETAYLTRSPANAKRLLAGMRQLEQGKGVKKTIQELEAYERESRPE